MSVKMILLHPYVRIDRKTVYKEHPNGIEGRLGSRVVLRRIASMLLDHIRRPRVRSPFQTAFCAFPTYLRSTFIDIGYVGSARERSGWSDMPRLKASIWLSSKSQNASVPSSKNFGFVG